MLAVEKPAKPKGGKARRGPGWRDDDLKRAVDVAEKAGLRSYRVEIAADGTITIVVGDQA